LGLGRTLNVPNRDLFAMLFNLVRSGARLGNFSEPIRRSGRADLRFSNPRSSRPEIPIDKVPSAENAILN
jgi:hypothetical protein